MLLSMTFGALGALAPAGADDQPQYPAYPAYPGAPAEGCLTVSPTVLGTGDTISITNNCGEPIAGFLNKDLLPEGLPTTFTIPCDNSLIRTHTLTSVLPPTLGTIEIQNTIQHATLTDGVEVPFADSGGPIDFDGVVETQVFYDFTLDANTGLITMVWNDSAENAPLARVLEDGTFDRYYISFVPELLADATLFLVDADGAISPAAADDNQPSVTVVDGSNLVVEFGPGVEVGPGFSFAIGLQAETLYSAAAEVLVSGVGPNCVELAPTPTAVPAPTAIVIVNPAPTAVVVHPAPAPVVIVHPAPAVIHPAPAPIVHNTIVHGAANYGFGSSLPAVHAVTAAADADKKATALAHTGSDNTYFIYAALSMIAAGAVAMGTRSRRVEIEG